MWQDYCQETKLETARRIERLIDAVLTAPFIVIGKPEPRRYAKVKGCWSCRITKEHRLVYFVRRGIITFVQCRYHY